MRSWSLTDIGSWKLVNCTGLIYWLQIWMTQTNIWWSFWRGCFSGSCAFECQLVLCAAVQNLSCSPIGGVKDALEWKDFSRWEEISPTETETEIYARLSVFPPNTNTDLHPHLQCCLACTFLLSFLGGGESLSKKNQCTNVEMNTKRKQKKLSTYMLYSAAPTLLSIPLSNCQLLPSREFWRLLLFWFFHSFNYRVLNSKNK